MKFLIKVWFSIIALPTIIILISNLANKILSAQVINWLSNVLQYVDKLIWTTNTNYILIGVTIILIHRMTRWFLKFLTWEIDQQD